MPYVKGQIEDERIHDRHHRTVLGGIDYPGYKNETVVARYTDDLDGRSTSTMSTNRRISSGDFQNSRIVVVSMESTPGTGALTGTSSHEKRKVSSQTGTNGRVKRKNALDESYQFSTANYGFDTFKLTTFFWTSSLFRSEKS